MSPVLHIACAIDEFFSYPLSVMLVSVLENHKQSSLHIHLFSAALPKQTIDQINDLVKKYNQQFSYYKLNQVLFEGLPTNERISYAAYYRILMPDNIAPDVDRFLYLDADIIVLGDLNPLFSVDLQGKIFGAVNDIAAIDWNMHHKHSIPDEYLYFNSGVLLIDRNQWLAENATNQVFEYLKKNHSLCDYHDQDGLNGALYNKRYNLSPVWNQQIGIYFIDKELLKKAYSNYKQALAKPVIVHFNGKEKPWHFVSNHPYTHEFNKYAKWAGVFLIQNHKTFKKFIKRFVVYPVLGWKRVNKFYYYKTRPV